MAKPAMYEWPESQICMDCKHGEFIMSDKLVNSNYLSLEVVRRMMEWTAPRLNPVQEEP